MSKFLRAVKNSVPEKDNSEITESDLKKWGLGVCKFLRDFSNVNPQRKPAKYLPLTYFERLC